MTLAFLLVPRELQSISATTCAHSSLFISSLFKVTSSILLAQKNSKFIEMIRSNFLDSISTDSNVFYVERSSGEDTPARNNTPAALTTNQRSRAMARELITVSSIASLEPQIMTKESDSNKPTIPCGYARQVPIIPLSLNDLNLPLDPFSVMTSLSLAPITEAQLPNARIPSIPIEEDAFDVTDKSLPSMLVSSINRWWTSLYDGTFDFGEPRRIFST